MGNQIFGVATKGIIYKEGKYLLLYKSEKEDINPESYDIPGGRLKFGEKPEEAVVREIKEETGLDAEQVAVFNSWTFTKEDFQLVGIDFLCRYLGGTEQISEEHSSFKWMSAEEINQDESLPGWIKKTIKKVENFLPFLTN